MVKDADAGDVERQGPCRIDLGGTRQHRANSYRELSDSQIRRRRNLNSSALIFRIIGHYFPVAPVALRGCSVATLGPAVPGGNIGRSRRHGRNMRKRGARTSELIGVSCLGRSEKPASRRAVVRKDPSE
jgi:hypothetical protein